MPSVGATGMAISPRLIERIYEAAALPDQWPSVLSAVGQACGAPGALFFTNSLTNFSWTSAPEVAWIIEDYIAQGWIADNVRGAPMIAEFHPGFRTDSDYRTAAERAALPVYRDFLIPRGIDAAAGTMFQGAFNDAIVMTVEHFPSHAHAAAAVPLLDALRPHLGRALSLAARLSDTVAATATMALGSAGTAAAVVSGDGRLRSVNDQFVAQLGGRITEQGRRLRFADPFVQARLAGALTAVEIDRGVHSVALAPAGDHAAAVLHLLPLRRGARDVFGWDGVLILLAEPANARVPGADVLRLLFDLTPAEARLTRLLLEGSTMAEAAAAVGVSDHTARTQLRSVFAKTGVSRQAELVRLLLGLGAPH